MNKKPVDKTKKSNVKCEHCKFWNPQYGGFYECLCKESRRYKTRTNYWNRCKYFGWSESEDAE